MDIIHHVTKDCTPKHATIAVQTPAIPSQFHISAKHGTSYRQNLNEVSSRSQDHLEFAANSQFVLHTAVHRLCNLLGEALQVVALKTKGC